MAEPDTWHHLAIYQNDPKSGCVVSLRIRGPERLKLTSFRWIFWVSNFETFPGVFVAITCANGAHLWPVWSSMLIPFFTRLITFNSILRFKLLGCHAWIYFDLPVRVSWRFQTYSNIPWNMQWFWDGTVEKCSQDKLDRIFGRCMASLHKLLVDVSFCCGFCTPPCLDDKSI